jgi:hypothetical protein
MHGHEDESDEELCSYFSLQLRRRRRPIDVRLVDALALSCVVLLVARFTWHWAVGWFLCTFGLQ